MKKYVYEINIDGEDAPAKILRAVGKKKRVLEVGCASGVQSRILKEKLECSVIGIEIDEEAAQQAGKYCDAVIVGDIESLDFKEHLFDRKFDVITIADVLEHLRKPGSALKRLSPFLSEDGVIIASIPNIVFGGLILEMARGRFDYRPYGLLDDTHLRFFTLKSIHRLFEQADLEVLHIDRANRTIEESEFCQYTLTSEELYFLEFIKTKNPEWSTYQFIVTARPYRANENRTTLNDIKNQETIRDLELQISSLTEKNKKIQSQLSWITAKPAYRIYDRIKKLLSAK